MNGLFIVDSDYNSLVQKGVVSGIAARNEGGFLGEAITVHPFALCDRNISLSGGACLVEIRNPTGGRVRPILWLRYLLHLCVVLHRVTGLVRRHRIDFIRAQDPYFCGLLGYIAARITGRKFCISVHADYDRMEELAPGRAAPRIFQSRYLAKCLERFLFSRADRILAITEYTARYAERNGAREDRIRLFRHMLDMSDFCFTPHPGGNVISVVSRLSLQKHILDVVTIALALKQRGVVCRIEVAGDGDLRDQLEDMIRCHELNKMVVLLGFQDRRGVADLYRRAAVNLALHGGASLIEASFSGRPTVAYDWEWHREAVIDGETGCLVAEGDQLAAADALADLLSAPERSSQMGRNANQLIMKKYDGAALLEARRDVYRGLVGSGIE